MSNGVLNDVFRQAMYYLPTWLVLLAGCVLAIVHFRRARQPASMVLVACFLLFSEGVLSIVARAIITSSNVSFQVVNNVLTALGVVSNLVVAGCMALLIGAAFVGRKE